MIDVFRADFSQNTNRRKSKILCDNFDSLTEPTIRNFDIFYVLDSFKVYFNRTFSVNIAKIVLRKCRKNKEKLPLEKFWSSSKRGLIHSEILVNLVFFNPWSLRGIRLIENICHFVAKNTKNKWLFIHISEIVAFV